MQKGDINSIYSFIKYIHDSGVECANTGDIMQRDILPGISGLASKTMVNPLGSQFFFMRTLLHNKVILLPCEISKSNACSELIHSFSPSPECCLDKS